MKNYVMVHGAWGEGSEFDEVKKLLRADGSKVFTPDLPGHGNNFRPINKVTMDAYVERVADAVNDVDGKAILVGHSLAGMIISQVAESIPQKIERLVYVCAMLPKNGDTAMGLMQSDKDGQLLSKLVLSECQTYATLRAEDIREILLHDADDAHIGEMIPKLSMKQATQPFMAAVQLSAANFGSVRKHYVRASLDKVLSPSLQDEMIANWKVDQVSTLASGHFPMTSIASSLFEVIRK
ncbi:alpha/beta fold hydrolase [Geothrix fermentans]|jgi:pimeloyl-ACP methyl ester carboxylesterase|uniref:alpha/beta fold hydrolase n=1 Tax=Geothrix fermentans TaxID=44676 RepID=UPI00047ECA72|nr:alpha/beta fold hydrolase [Geothrix fermentans]